MRRKQLRPLLFIVLVAIASVSAVLISDTSPQLGLDLQGGISVVLQPTKEADDAALSQTIEIVGDTAELRFRPVMSSIPGSIEDILASTTTTEAGASTTTAADGSTTTTAAGDATTTTVAPVTGQSAAGGATPFQDPATTTTTEPADPGATTTTTVAPSDEPPITGFELTPREDDVADQPVVLAEYKDEKIAFTYQLGPSGATGQIVSTARAELGPTGAWAVALEIKGGDSIDAFNAMSAQCFSKSETCPTGQLAIVLDSRVVSAPTIQQASFQRDQIQISGSFSESEAKDLALVLRYGSLPVNLEPQTIQTVSASLGKDSLKAGLIAGFVGLGLVCLYMLVYYRALGMVVIMGLTIWSALNFAIICWLGETQGLALSLAGVTGLVVSVGITVDSYVVFFERLKDDVRLGRTLRTSTERSWQRAFRTIIAANVSSLIGAVLLYVLTVGPVRGFAFFLALATSLDVVVAWFFIRPMVALLGRSKIFTEARWWGVARGLGAPKPSVSPVPGGGS
jgi:preprotein translocase subunit SecD